MPQVSELDRERMEALTAGLHTKSDKIRKLAAAGYKRADIARHLGIRYQFVYNVLSAPQPGKVRRPRGIEQASAPAPTAVPGRERSEPTEPSPRWIWTRVRKGGAVALPAAFLKALGVAEGDQVQLALEGDRVRVLSRAAAIRDVQRHVRRYVPEGVSLVDELLAERRAEAARESSGGTDG